MARTREGVSRSAHNAQLAWEALRHATVAGGGGLGARPTPCPSVDVQGPALCLNDDDKAPTRTLQVTVAGSGSVAQRLLCPQRTLTNSRSAIPESGHTARAASVAGSALFAKSPLRRRHARRRHRGAQGGVRRGS